MYIASLGRWGDVSSAWLVVGNTAKMNSDAASSIVKTALMEDLAGDEDLLCQSLIQPLFFGSLY